MKLTIALQQLLPLTISVGVFAIAGCAPALIQASRRGDEAAVLKELRKGADVNMEHNGVTPLSASAWERHKRIVDLLLSHGADANFIVPGTGQTPLRWAVGGRAGMDIIKTLVEHGADPWHKDRYGVSPYDAADPNYGVPVGVRRYFDSLSERALPVRPSSDATANRTRVGDAAPLSRDRGLVPLFAGSEQANTYAVIVGVEAYPDLPPASNAVRDASSVREFVRRLGVPERNVSFLTESRATRSGIEKIVESWLPNNISEDARVYFYFSGHGAPDPKSGDAYLVPFDGDPKYLQTTGYPLKRLYGKLAELKSRQILVALDACFSGAGGRSVMTKGARPLVGQVKLASETRASNTVVLAAAASDEIAGAKSEAGYGLFTYHFLQGLNGAAKDSRGRITVKSLYDYLKPMVQDEAKRDNREQTPQLIGVGADQLVLIGD